MSVHLKKIFLAVLLLTLLADINAQQDSLATDSIIKRANEILQKYAERTLFYDTSDYEPGNGLAYDINLQIAASHGYCIEIVRLLKRGASIDNMEGGNATPLHYAIAGGHKDAAELLLLLGASTEKRDIFGNTPLTTAVMNADLSTAELIIRHGALLSGSDAGGSTALHHAAAKGDFYITDMLLYYEAPADSTDSEKNTPLMIAVWSAYPDIADLLLMAGANPNIPDRKGFTPFMVAAQNGDTLLMKMLSDHGADIYASNFEGYNALTIAVKAGRTEAVKYLLRNGNLWLPRSDNRAEPVSVALNYGHRDIIPLLKEEGFRSKIEFGFDDFSFSAGGLLTSHYTLISADVAIREPRLKAGITAGIDFNPARTRLLLLSDHEIHQYRLKTTVIHAGIFKQLSLDNGLGSSRINLLISLSAAYRFHSYYSGTRQKPEEAFCVIPYAGIELSRKSIGVRGGVSYLNMPFHRVGPLWIGAGVSYYIFRYYDSAPGKRIKLYDYE